MNVFGFMITILLKPKTINFSAVRNPQERVLDQRNKPTREGSKPKKEHNMSESHRYLSCRYDQ